MMTSRLREQRTSDIRAVLAKVSVAALALTWGCNRGNGEAKAKTATALAEAAHAGAPEASGGPEAATISLSPEAQANIGLTVVHAQVRSIERTLLLNATLQVDPDRDALVSPRVQGKVLAVHVGIGDRVKRGQPLVTLQSLQIAETPPSVEVTSPLDGSILERSVTVGATVDPTTTLLRVADLSRVLAQAEVYESDIARIRVGQAARLRVTSYPDRVFTGRVIRLADVIDAERRTLRVWIEVPNAPEQLLKPAMFGQVVLVVARQSSAVVVPNEAVQVQGPEQFVFVRNGDGFERQPVIVGDRDDRYTAIKSGVVDDDEVVTRGAAQLATVTSQPFGGGVQDESKPHSH